MNSEILTSRLEARVAAVNRCHAIACELLPKFTELFLPLVGKKIVRKTPYRMLTAAARWQKDAFEALSPRPGSLYVTVSGQYLVIEFTGEASYRWRPDDAYERLEQHKWTAHVRLADDRIADAHDLTFILPSKVWSVEEVKRLEAARENASEELRTAERNLGPFASWN